MVSKNINPAVSFLDEKFPGWENKIDLSKLDMKSSDCIVGQTTGNQVKWDVVPGGAIVETYSGKEVIPHNLGIHFTPSTESQWRALVASRR